MKKATTAKADNSLAFKLKQGKQQKTEAPHLIIRALAGTGKTWTDIVGVAYAFAPRIWQEVSERLGNPTPSEEQLAIWESFKLSQGDVRNITYCAFNRSIVSEFSEKWGWLVDALKTNGINLWFSTINSLGNSCVTKAYGRLNVTDRHTETLLASYTNRDIWDLRRSDALLVGTVSELVSLCKLTLAGWTEAKGFLPAAVTPDVLDQLSSWYDIDMNSNRQRIYELVPEMLQLSQDVEHYREMDFNDQNWIPVVNRLSPYRCDLVLVDELQDLPRCKQEFVRLIGKRIVGVGDVNQAVYGFAGADVDSIPRMEGLLAQDTRSLQVLKLTETYRCAKLIVQEAQQFVPDFKAHSSNPEGIVRHQSMAKYPTEAQDGDMVLCRVNAPLISQALRFLKDGRKAIVRGRDFGGSLIKFINRFKCASVIDLLRAVDDWCQSEVTKESAKRNPSDARILALQDRKSCIEAFSEGANNIEDITTKINLVFAGKQCPLCTKHYNEELERCPNNDCKKETDPITKYACGPKLVNPKGVLFSSVHKAKGLEANRVFILRPRGAEMPHPMAKTAWQQQQELNCLYIATTRAKLELVYVR